MQKQRINEKPYQNNIKYLIKIHGYTIQEIAREIDIPRSTLTDYIVGNRPAPKACLQAIARIIGCDVENFQYHPVSEKPDPTKDDMHIRDQITQLLSLSSSESEAEMKFDRAKRQSILKLLALAEAIAIVPLEIEAWERLLAGTDSSSALNAASLTHFERLIEECWHLCDSNEMKSAGSILASFMPEIVASVQANSKTAYLASHGLRLQSVFAHHQMHIAEKVRLCQQSVAYARLADDTNALVTALVELADAYEFIQAINECLQTLQEAVHLCISASPLVQSRAYSNYAVILASMKREREADLYIHLAQEVFPENPLVESAYALADANVFTLSYHVGLVRLYAQRYFCQPQDFEWYIQHPSGKNIPERLRLEIVNGQCRAAVHMQDVEQFAHFLEKGAVGAITLGSRKRFEELRLIFQQEMPQCWITHNRIKDIAEQYHLEKGKAQ